MSTDATRIRDAIVERLTVLPLGYKAIRKVPVPQLQLDLDHLPALSVVILDEDLTPDGEANAGAPDFVAEITIGISHIIGFAKTDQLDVDADAAVNIIEATLLTDPTFTRRGIRTDLEDDDADRYPLFEAITRIKRRRNFPKDGESYFVELQLDLTFETRVSFEPVIPDAFLSLSVASAPASAGAHTPRTELLFDVPQEPTP